jgi:FeS assembly SUF system protein
MSADENGMPDATATADTAPADALRARVIDELRTVYDPEIPVNIYELGLVYQVEASPEGHVQVRMTLTSPMCPVAESLPPEVEAKIRAVPGVSSTEVEVVWEPPWSPAMMSEAARLELNL